jgi:hypothetical protein
MMRKKVKSDAEHLENEMPAHVGVLFSQMPHRFFHSVSMHPHTIQIWV